MTQTLPKELQTIGPSELALILRKSESTIRRDASRSPHTLPPRVQAEGKKKPLLWRTLTVEYWLSQKGVTE